MITLDSQNKIKTEEEIKKKKLDKKNIKKEIKSKKYAEQYVNLFIKKLYNPKSSLSKKFRNFLNTLIII